MSDLDTATLRGIVARPGPPTSGPTARDPSLVLATTIWYDYVSGVHYQCMPIDGVLTWVTMGIVSDVVADGFSTPQMFGAKGDGIADDIVPLEQALAYAIDRHPNGLAVGRRVLYLPPGLYRITRPFVVGDVELLVLRGEPGQSGILFDSPDTHEAALDMPGVRQSVVEGINVGSTDASVGLRNLLAWYYDGVVPCSRVAFRDLVFGGQWSEAAVKIGATGIHANGQCDNSLWENVVVGGQWGWTGPSRLSGRWKYGFKIGTGTFGNCLIHDLVHCVVSSVERAIGVHATNATVHGGSVGGCSVAFDLQAPQGYTRIDGVRVEGATRLIETGEAGGATSPFSATVSDCYFVLEVPVPGNFVLNRGVGIGTSLFQDPSAAWSVDQYAGKIFRLFNGATVGDVEIFASVVVSNDATTLALADALPAWAATVQVYALSPPVTAATPTTLTDATQAWPQDNYVGLYAVITAGAGAGQWRTVIASSADTLALDQPWEIVPDATSGYAIMAGAPDGQWIRYKWPGTLRLCNVTAGSGLWLYEASVNPSIYIGGSVRTNAAIIDGMNVEGGGFKSSGNGTILVRMFYGTQGGNVMPAYTIVEKTINA